MIHLLLIISNEVKDIHPVEEVLAVGLVPDDPEDKGLNLTALYQSGTLDVQGMACKSYRLLNFGGIIVVNKIHFNKLTPKDDTKIDAYIPALNFAIDDISITNIALTGPYASGKSSVIDSYIKEASLNHIDINNKNSLGVKFAKISLAKYNESLVKEEEINNHQVNLIEGKILNQMLHQTDPKFIPKTMFKIKEPLNKFKLCGNVIMFFAIILMNIYMIFSKKINAYTSELDNKYLTLIFSISRNKELVILIYISFLIYIIYISYKFLEVNSGKFILKQFNFQGAAIEVLDNEKINESYFDKYLNELIYLFNQAKVDVVIFEDMDRFNKSEIFVKLREINIVLNNKRRLSNRKPIKFIYLLNDDVFETKDRVKFFDFIIPVVPVVDSSNSLDIFLEVFENQKLKNDFNQDFLRGLSLYIDDMRLLYNITNEYIIYKLNLQDINPNTEKLLSMITYKNLFPKDFIQLQKKEGYLYNILSNKDKYIETLKLNLSSDIRELSLKIEELKKEIFNSLEELEYLYLSRKITGIYSVNNKDLNEFNSIQELMKEAKETNIVLAYNQYRGGYRLNINEALEEIYKDEEFKVRKNLYIKSRDEALQKLNEKVRRKNQSLDSIKNMRLKDILQQLEVSEYVTNKNDRKKFENIIESPYFDIIKYLLNNGFIDEGYNDYLTHFYPNSISYEDKKFLRSFNDKKKLDYSFELNNIEQVVNRLSIDKFSQKEIMNYSLFSFLLERCNSYGKQLELIFNQINSNKLFSFIVGFEPDRTICEIYINLLEKYYPNILIDIINEDNYAGAEKNKFFETYIIFSSNTNEIYMEKDNKLNIELVSDFISLNNIDFKSYPMPYNLPEKLNLLKVKYNDLNNLKLNSKFLELVYKNNLYKINLTNIIFCLRNFYGSDKNDIDIISATFTNVISNKEEPLYKYISLNLDRYLDILISSDLIFREEESALIELLNSLIRPLNHWKYLEKNSTKISNLNKVNEKELWKILVSNRAVDINLNNIFNYIEAFKGIDINLVDFINDTTDEITVNYFDLKGNKDLGWIFIELLRCDKLNNKFYMQIVKLNSEDINGFDIEGLSKDKVKILLDNKTLQMNQYNLDMLRRYKNEECLLKFIRLNIEDYIKLMSEELFEYDEYLMILKSDIRSTYKERLLGFNKESISIQGLNLSRNLTSKILSSYFNINDLEFLIQDYEFYRDKYKQELIEIFNDKFNQIFEERINLTYNIVKDILSGEYNYGNEQKKKLLILCLQNLSIENAKSLLDEMKFTEYKKIFEEKNPKIMDKDLDREILEIFINKKWINRYDNEMKDNNNYLRVFSRKLKTLQKI